MGTCVITLMVVAMFVMETGPLAYARDKMQSSALSFMSGRTGDKTDIIIGQNSDSRESIIKDQLMKSGSDEARDNIKDEKTVKPGSEETQLDRGKPDYNKLKELDDDNKSKIRFVTARNEYIGLILGYGGYFPLADYGARYKPAHILSAVIPVYYLNFFGISPEIHVRYVQLESKSSNYRYGSTISMAQIFPALVYRYDIKLPGTFKGPVTVFARVYDGVARVAYASENKIARIVGDGTITDWINIFGISAGCTITVYKGLFVGVETGYSVIATSGKPLQAMSFGVNAGYKIF